MNYDYGIMSDDGIGTRFAALVGRLQRIDREAIAPRAIGTTPIMP